MAQRKDVAGTPPPIDTLSDSEMMEALSPLAKQLRSLNQIQEGLHAYFQAKNQIDGLIAERDKLAAANAKAQADYNENLAGIQKQIMADSESIVTKRQVTQAENDKIIFAQNDEMAAVMENIKKLTKRNSELDKLVKTKEEESAKRIQELTDKGNELAASLDKQIADKKVELAKVTEVFNKFMAEHGLTPSRVEYVEDLDLGDKGLDG
jgi:type I site-specific restriction endonuclease